MRNELIVGILVFIISIPVGYFLNSYLSRDQVTIENLEIVPKTNKYAVNKKDLAEINSFREINMFNGGYSYPDLPDEIDQEQISWLRKNLSTKKVNAEIYIEKIESSIKKINSKPKDMPVKEVFSTINLSSISNFYFSPKDMSKDDVLASLKRTKINLETYVSDIDSLINDLSNYKKIRTGEFEIIATLLNSGDTDGLIKYKGIVNVKGYPTEIPVQVKRVSYGIPNNFYFNGPRSSEPLKSKSTTIGKRTMVELVFSVDKAIANNKILEEIQELVKSKQPIDVSLKLFDFRGDSIESKPYKLYASD